MMNLQTYFTRPQINLQEVSQICYCQVIVGNFFHTDFSNTANGIRTSTFPARSER